MDMHGGHSASPVNLLRCGFTNRQLILQLAKREVSSRYRGSVMGVAWSFINPLLLLTIYTFVFSNVFNARWGGGASIDSKFDYALVLFIGLIIHGFCAECINTSPKLIVSNVNYVKKVVFPIEVLALTSVLNALFHFLISFAVLFVAQLVLVGGMSLSALWFPVIMLPLVLMMAGVSWFLSALGTYVRDIGQITGMLVTALLFLSPVFYPLSALPEKYRGWLYMNPLTSVIENSRAVLLFGQSLNVHDLLVSAGIGVAVFMLGYAFFQKTRTGFADVL